MRISDWSSDVCSSDLDQRALDKVSGAGHQHQQIGNVTDRLIGVADLVVDVDGPSGGDHADEQADRSEEHTSELQSLMRISYAVFCLKKKNKANVYHHMSTTVEPTYNTDITTSVHPSVMHSKCLTCCR